MMSHSEAASLDRYLTRNPYDDSEPPIYRCACGRFLPADPTYTNTSTRVLLCDGKPTVIECSYNDGTHEEILRIIGEEHRHSTYTLAYAPACGSKNGSHDGHEQGEISPDAATSYEHAPHYYADPYGDTATAVRVCSCGRANEEAL